VKPCGISVFGGFKPEFLRLFGDEKLTAKVSAYPKPSGQPIQPSGLLTQAFGAAYRRPLTQPNALNLYAFTPYEVDTGTTSPQEANP